MSSDTLTYGSWPSPISAAAVAAGSHPIDAARFVGDEIWWSERMPAEGGRTAVRRMRPGGTIETLLPAPWDARSRVHEYGGGAWTATHHGSLLFVDKRDQRVWRLDPGSAPVPLTPESGAMRFADLQPADGELHAVRETHRGSGGPVRDIVAIPLNGSAADDPRALRSVVAGSDFFAYPCLSPDGARLAWIAWDHPDMPWDATQLRVGELLDGVVAEWSTIAGAAGDARQSVLQPVWLTPTELMCTTDASGRWNLRRHTIDGHTTDGDTTGEPIAAADADTGGPLWNLATQWYLPLDDGRIVAVRTNGSDELVVVDPTAGAVHPIDSPAASRVLLDDAQGSRVLFHGGGAATLGGLWLLDLDEPGGRPTLIRGAADDEPDASWFPVARMVHVEGPTGPVHSFAYPPTNPRVAPPGDELPPYLVLAHGGPTSHASGGASLDIAYFTSRGIGVLEVNYGGSSGYGRAYRERLNGLWGIVDRDDVIAAASGLAAQGIADGARLAIRGGSAGGWTVLCALTASDRFAAGISRYGVADLRALAADTHDFEARYLDRLVGALPEAESLYVERSPLTHLDGFGTPMLLEQGLEDEVVPPSQSEAVRDALAARGIPHAYLAFEGEGHGFRRADTIVRTLEAELSFLGQILGFSAPGVALLPLE